MSNEEFMTPEQLYYLAINEAIPIEEEEEEGSEEEEVSESEPEKKTTTAPDNKRQRVNNRGHSSMEQAIAANLNLNEDDDDDEEQIVQNANILNEFDILQNIDMVDSPFNPYPPPDDPSIDPGFDPVRDKVKFKESDHSYTLQDVNGKYTSRIISGSGTRDLIVELARLQEATNFRDDPRLMLDELTRISRANSFGNNADINRKVARDALTKYLNAFPGNALTNNLNPLQLTYRKRWELIVRASGLVYSESKNSFKGFNHYYFHHVAIQHLENLKLMVVNNNNNAATYLNTIATTPYKQTHFIILLKFLFNPLKNVKFSELNGIGPILLQYTNVNHVLLDLSPGDQVDIKNLPLKEGIKLHRYIELKLKNDTSEVVELREKEDYEQADRFVDQMKQYEIDNGAAIRARFQLGPNDPVLIAEGVLGSFLHRVCGKYDLMILNPDGTRTLLDIKRAMPSAQKILAPTFTLSDSGFSTDVVKWAAQLGTYRKLGILNGYRMTNHVYVQLFNPILDDCKKIKLDLDDPLAEWRGGYAQYFKGVVKDNLYHLDGALRPTVIELVEGFFYHRWKLFQELIGV